MHDTRRARLLGALLIATAPAAACSLSDGPSDEERIAAAATAAPGEYGEPVDPSLPMPSDVATDTPVSPGPATDARLFVTYSGWNAQSGAVEVGSYLPTAVESDGTCTLTLTRGETSVTASTTGTPNVTSTSCGGLSIPGSEVSSGTWVAVVSYESATSSGSSEPVEVEVP
ncbi:hypothetical protein ACI78T_15535 [Blastococcus sp. SYSU D00922]